MSDAIAYYHAVARNHGQALALAQRIANLNPDAGEIGEGMLRSLVEDAQRVVEGYNEMVEEEYQI